MTRYNDSHNTVLNNLKANTLTDKEVNKLNCMNYQVDVCYVGHYYLSNGIEDLMVISTKYEIDTLKLCRDLLDLGQVELVNKATGHIDAITMI